MEINNNLYRTSLAFAEALRDTLGEDEGHEVWTQVCDLVGPTFGKAMMMDMLRNRRSDFCIKSVVYDYKKINLIKLVREVSGLGLRQAKNVVEDVAEHGEEYKCEYPSWYEDKDYAYAVKRAKDAGAILG